MGRRKEYDDTGKELIKCGIITDVLGDPIEPTKKYIEAWYNDELRRPEFVATDADTDRYEKLLEEMGIKPADGEYAEPESGPRPCPDEIPF